MAPRDGQESSSWSKWMWVEEKQMWKSEERDYRGNILDIQWQQPPPTTKPRYSSQGAPVPTQHYKELPAMNSQLTPNYAYGTSATQERPGYPDTTFTGAPQYPNTFNERPAPSGYQRPYSTSTGQSATLNYETTRYEPAVFTNYPTTPSGWPAPVRRGYPVQMPQNSQPYYQGQNDESMRGSSGFGSQQRSRASFGKDSYSRDQNTSRPAPMIPPRTSQESRAEKGSDWNPENSDTVPPQPSSGYGAGYGTLNKGSGYQNEYPNADRPTAPSGFAVNTAAINRSGLPRDPRSRPQSMYVSSGTRPDIGVPSSQAERTPSFRDDSIDAITTGVSRFAINDQSTRRPFTKIEKVLVLDVGTSERHHSMTHRLCPKTSLKLMGHKKWRVHRLEGLRYINEKPMSMQTGTRRARRSRPGVGRADVVQDNSRTPRQELRSDPTYYPGVPQTETKRPSQYQNPMIGEPRDSIGSATSLHPPGERPPKYESNKNPRGSAQGQNRDSEREKHPYSNPAYTTTTQQQYPEGSRVITTKHPDMTYESLHPQFCKHESKHFRKGRVFKVLWSEPLGGNADEEASSHTTLDDESCINDSKHNQKAYHTVRRFVIVIAKDGHCLCVPIFTYGRQGTNKPGVKAKDHAIIYTSKNAPAPLSGENDIHRRPVRVESTDPREKLHSTSRVNYAKIYTVEHNVKVHFIGRIHDDSKATFFTDFEDVLLRG